MILSRVLDFLVKRALYLVLLPGLAVYGYIQHQAPRQPDPASGHVFRVIAPRGRHMDRHVMYLTGTERFLYHASFIVIAASTFGMIGYAFIQKSKRATSLG